MGFRALLGDYIAPIGGFLVTFTRCLCSIGSALSWSPDVYAAPAAAGVSGGVFVGSERRIAFAVAGSLPYRVHW